MKKSNKRSGIVLTVALVLVTVMSCMIATGNAAPNTTETPSQAEMPMQNPATDDSPAIYVAQKNENSVVGIITNTETWDRTNGVQNIPRAQGSGVVIADGGYVLTNNHVIEGGSAWQVLLPDGEKVDATLVGADSAMDLAVLKVGEKTDSLVPVTIGSTDTLPIGSTVIAIGNPGGEILANTVTRGIVSALERKSVNSNNTTRNVDYIQHDAPINSGNSGGGLFDYQGNLIGINTLKYGGSYYSGNTYEGLGFAIPVETAYPIAQQLIEKGKVVRPQIGVVVSDQEGPDDPMKDYAPVSVAVMTVNEGSAAEKAGIKQYDFITAINGERVKSLRELATILDTFKPGDTVTLTIVRYNDVSQASAANDSVNPYGFNFGDYFGNNGGNYGNSGVIYGYNSLNVGGGYTTMDVQVTLEEKDT